MCGPVNMWANLERGRGFAPSLSYLDERRLVTAVQATSADSAGALLGGSELRKEASDFLALESSITPGGDAIRLYSSVATPPPQGVRMNMEESGYFPNCQHFIHMVAVSHIFSDLFFN